ncbi:MAG: phosphoenolpyruvate mutase [Nitrospira sp.]|nr:phosphoenolpyruvate mutase [Nitrospira sp.]
MGVVYVGMTVDILHHGHINVIETARQYGEVLVGLLTDSAIADHKRLPHLTYQQRQRIVGNIVGVSKIVPQEEWDYAPNIRRYRPDFMVHGDDWLDGPLAPYRARAIEALQIYGGSLIEIPYTPGVSSHALAAQMRSQGTTADIRRRTLKRLLAAKQVSRFIEVHNPLSALIAEHATVTVEGKVREFDGFWSSSLADATAKGKPDIEAVDISSRLANVNDIFEVTTKPMIFDGDTGGKLEHFEFNVRSLERLGISAVIIEDKKGLKRNSLLGTDVTQYQEEVEEFCAKIQAGRRSRVSEDFLLIARCESLILGRGLQDAMMRARAYVEAGADGIMIHSLMKTPDEVLEFARLFRNEFQSIPLICVPTSYHTATADVLATGGFNVVIYANHLLRAAYPAMQRVAHEILYSGRSTETEPNLLGIPEILKLIPTRSGISEPPSGNWVGSHLAASQQVSEGTAVS